MIKKLDKGIFILGVAFYIIIFVLNTLMSGVHYRCKKDFLVPNILLLIIGILLIAGSSFLVKKYENKISNFLKGYKFIIIVSVLLFLVEIFISVQVLFLTGWDAGMVNNQAFLVSQGEIAFDNGYYSFYPNNLLITFIYTLIYKVAALFGMRAQGFCLIIVFNCLINVLTGFLLYHVSRKIFKREIIARIAWIIYAVWIGILPWYIITYSDPIGILIPILILWIYQSMENKKIIWQKSVLIGIIAFIGFSIKPSTVIIYIAVLIVTFLLLLRDKEKKIRGIQIGCFILSFFVVSFVYKKVDIASRMGFALNEECEFTFMHFAMMGLSEESNGVYDGDDVAYSASFTSKEERIEGNINVIKQRISDFGLTGLGKHLAKKILTNYNDGTFGWGNEGDFFYTPIDTGKYNFMSGLREVYYEEGKYNIFLNTYMQIFWITTLFGVILNIFSIIKKKDISEVSLIIMLSLIGIFLFVSLFEARARYVYVYAPLYIIMGLRGYMVATQLIFKSKFFTKKTVNQSI